MLLLDKFAPSTSRYARRIVPAPADSSRTGAAKPVNVQGAVLVMLDGTAMQYYDDGSLRRADRRGGRLSRREKKALKRARQRGR